LPTLSLIAIRAHAHAVLPPTKHKKPLATSQRL
jgi:hypothetical protein